MAECQQAQPLLLAPAGLIPYIKIGRAVRYRTSDVERALST